MKTCLWGAHGPQATCLRLEIPELCFRACEKELNSGAGPCHLLSALPEDNGHLGNPPHLYLSSAFYQDAFLCVYIHSTHVYFEVQEKGHRGLLFFE